ncbi:nucleotide-binding universal stress UspA family protein [Dokdonia sp. Hel_I_63]|jgi:nucleotide-binding universal stress UspA family protein|uniref:universal stress protein n=1 Tax=unclassified Dokdonia TaxID=2615033 RepID=UPI00020A6845|nr:MULTISPECIES: universal stress protein [unclassified Dokdonia]AEE19533.1 UspA domain-containing protein [Dokdonia sp. 4H-3-7-5]TVZ21239.1 nucleotide-binding universal stress UspA family protein [Dokdonia sp. Hel_I_63]
MIKKILVPTDFSEQAENALRVAADLAKKHNASINLLHMVDLPMTLVDAVTGNQSELPEAIFFMKLAHQRFESMMSAPFLDGVTIEESAEFDGAFEGIMDYVDKYQSDLIVMGSHGDSGLHEFFIGSNAEKVVRNSKIPVLIIKNRHEHFEIENFIYALDFQAENHNAFKQAIAFAKINNAQLHMLYVNTPGDFRSTHEVEEQMKKFMDVEGQVENCTLNIYNDNTIESGILHFAEMIDSGLVGIATHGRKGLAHFLNGSLSEGLVNHAKRPVITFRI